MRVQLNIIQNQWRTKDFSDMGKGVKGVPNPKVGAPTYYLATFARKLHKKEKNCIKREGCVLGPPGSANENCIQVYF